MISLADLQNTADTLNTTDRSTLTQTDLLITPLPVCSIVLLEVVFCVSPQVTPEATLAVFTIDHLNIK